MNNFWQDLPRPFTVLAPMEGVTDFVFREIINQIGKPHVFFTEFTSVEGLNSVGFEAVKESLRFNQHEKPIVAQLWGQDLSSYTKAAVLCRELGFSGIDINMGCPVRIVTNKGSCSALINNPKLASKIIESVREGSEGNPVSVKTRLGFANINLDWIKFLLEQNIDTLTIHLRTVSELSKVPAHWDLMSEVMILRDKISPKTLIIGNGDIKTYKEIDEKFALYKCDGFMVGRGVFHNPWIFNRKIEIEKISINERKKLFINHINLFDNTWPEKNPAFLKKFCKTYICNFPEAGDLREKIMKCSKTEEMLNILNNNL